jgi:UDP-N-acetylglucosamine pyrophosphorylase
LTVELTQAIENKMRAAGVPPPAISAFLDAVRQVASGERGLLPETGIDLIESLPRFDKLPEIEPRSSALLDQLAVLKLNGGLGTSMGLEKTKSLIPVKGPDAFLDFIARQILYLRGESSRPAFCLMNSFATQQDTLEYLKRYPSLAQDWPLDFRQNMVPKLDARTFAPVSWPNEPELEWCPPGHGDLYLSMPSSGLMDQLIEKGVLYMFVSNADNLGATVDLNLLQYFADSGLSFLMEVAERTAADRKGGHLARNRENGRFVLRESAQCPEEDEPQFQNIERHRFFNTNNLWIRLDDLKNELEKRKGHLSLPLIINTKTLDPKDPHSPRVLQLESAMGAAIGCFEKSGAIVVPRSRFAPVKTTSDLLALRSDAFGVTEDFRLVLSEARHGQPPIVELDPCHYKVLAEFDSFFVNGPPSLVACDSIKVTGPIRFEREVICEGQVEFHNPGSQPRTATSGIYRNLKVRLD